MIDTLDVGGAELMALNLANHLPRKRYRPYLCTTRRSGPLLAKVRSDVICLDLKRRNRFDLLALKRLVDFVREHEIQIIHAHGPSLFIAKVVTSCLPGKSLIWHAHYGGIASQNQRTRLYRLACSGATVIAVNEELADWARNRLGVPTHRVHYLRNFAVGCEASSPASDLPGAP